MITKRRKVVGVTQKELALYTGISPVTLSHIEQGYGNPTFDTLNEILHYLNLSIKIEPKQ
ncbi:MAG: helix-turn-helix domain-containing protein [FCB group bacterium]|nr:helix-turn-helix domain-containing protein [FCB group bacterium]